jgi:hypothetical protein
MIRWNVLPPSSGFKVSQASSKKSALFVGGFLSLLFDPEEGGSIFIINLFQTIQ